MAQTINQVLKAITAYAKKHNESYLEVRHIITCNDSGTLTHKYEAYINGFGIYAQAENIAGLIEKFEATKTDPKLINTHPAAPKSDPIDWDNLPF
jgi:hypothetical protein